MSQFELSKPKLKPTVIHAEGHRLVIEDTATRRHFILPAETLPIVQRLDGESTIQEIVTQLHASQPGFSFRGLFSTIQQLDQADFLESGIHSAADRKRGNPEELARKSHRLLDRLTFRFGLFSRIALPVKSEFLFYTLSSLLGLCFLASLITDHYFAFGNNFLQWASSLKGLAFLFAASSGLLTAKALIQGVLLFVATGQVHGISLKLSPLGFHLAVSDSSIYLSRGVRLPFVFHLASIASLIAFTGLFEIAFGNEVWFRDLEVITVLVTLLEMSPYGRSDLQKIFYLFQRDDASSHMLAYLRNRSLFSFLGKKNQLAGEAQLVAFATLSVAWSSGSLFFLGSLLEACFANLVIGISSGTLGNRLASGLILFGVSSSGTYFLLDLVATLLLNLAYPLTNPLMSAFRKFTAKQVSSPDDPALKEILRRNPLFQDCQDSTLDFLVKHSRLSTFARGTRLLLQGKENRELFAVVDGQVSVRRREPSGASRHVTDLGPGAVIGEISVIQEQPTTADVVAETRVKALVIDREVIRRLPEHESGAGEYEAIVGRVMLGHFVAASPLFRELPKEVIHMFVNEGKLQDFAKGVTITEQGSIDKTFYLLVHGKVEIVLDGTPIKQIGQGDFFGEIALIADVPRTATVRTLEECVLLRIDSEAFWRILAQNIHLSMFIESVAESRARETEERRAS